MKTQAKPITCAALIAGIACTAASLHGAENHIGDPLPDHPWKSGLYSSITIPFNCGRRAPKSARILRIAVPGMKKPMRARAVLQPRRAPLVVILNGTFGPKTNPINNLWMAWLEEKGFNVVTFNSTLTLTHRSRHGVAGCITVEAELSARIIHTILQHPDVRGRYGRIGIVGISYGGTQALLIDELKRNRPQTVPFEIAAIQAYSPPADLFEAIELLDEAYTQRWAATELYWAVGGKIRTYPVRRQLDQQKMRAAIAVSFRLGLKNVVEVNDRFFRKEMKRMGIRKFPMPEEAVELDENERIDGYAHVVSFRRYVDEMLVPYWTAKGVIRGKADLVRAGNLARLMRNAGRHVETILTTNDPLNTKSGTLRALRSERLGGRLTVLPRGGHLGYANAEWTRRKLETIFKQPVRGGSTIFSSPKR